MIDANLKFRSHLSIHEGWCEKIFAGSLRHKFDVFNCFKLYEI